LGRTENECERDCVQLAASMTRAPRFARTFAWALLVLAGLGVLGVGVFLLAKPPQRETPQKANASFTMIPVPAHIVRTCHRVQKRTRFRVLCPTRLPESEHGAAVGLVPKPPGPPTAGLLRDGPKIRGIDLHSDQLHFGVVDGRSRAADSATQLGEDLGTRSIGGYAGRVYFVSPDIYGYHSSHLAFAFRYGTHPYVASLHATGKRPGDEDFYLLGRLVAGLRHAPDIPMPRVAEPSGELGSHVAGPPIRFQASDVTVGGGGAWVTNYSRSLFLHVDESGRPSGDHIRVGRGPLRGIAFAGGNVFVAGAEGDVVSIVDALSGRLSRNIDVDDAPIGVAAQEGRVWVLAGIGQTVQEIDATRAVTRGRPIPVDGFPTTIDAGAGFVWVTDYASGSLHRLDPDTGQIWTLEGVAEAPGDVAVRAGSVWVTDFKAGTVVRMQASSGRIMARIPAGDTPNQVAPAAHGVWVTDYRGGAVLHIDALSNRVVETVPVGIAPDAIAAGRDFVWVTDGEAKRVYRIAVAAGR
jgi:hypothetical protein